MDSTAGADERLGRIAALGEPVRRDLYRFVVAAHAPVSREQAADGVGVPRHVAKFHLDRLAADGLLAVGYRRPDGRGGPGAGRPAKVYRRAEAEIAVSLPERRYDLAAQLMAGAIAASADSGKPVRETLTEAARQAGAELGTEARRRRGRRSGTTATLAAISATLAEVGYEPDTERGGRITLRNCPFHGIAEQYTELVCGMNLDLLTGLVDAVDPPSVEAHLDPTPGQCCVTLGRGARR